MRTGRHTSPTPRLPCTTSRNNQIGHTIRRAGKWSTKSADGCCNRACGKKKEGKLGKWNQLLHHRLFYLAFCGCCCGNAASARTGAALVSGARHVRSRGPPRAPSRCFVRGASARRATRSAGVARRPSCISRDISKYTVPPQCAREWMDARAA